MTARAPAWRRRLLSAATGLAVIPAALLTIAAGLVLLNAAGLAGAVLAFAARWWFPLFATREPPAPPRIEAGPVPGQPARGRLTMVTKKWECGCVDVWTGPGKVTAFPCPRHALDLDTELRSLLQACPGCGRAAGTWCPPSCPYAKDTTS